jgi:hypothetical protein
MDLNREISQGKIYHQKQRKDAKMAVAAPEVQDVKQCAAPWTPKSWWQHCAMPNVCSFFHTLMTCAR